MSDFNHSIYFPRYKLDRTAEATLRNHCRRISVEQVSTRNLKASSLKVCIVTDQLYRFDMNTDYGFYFYSLAMSLAELGHQVTVLYLRTIPAELTLLDANHRFASGGTLKVEPLQKLNTKVASGPSGDALQRTYQVYEDLLSRDNFDVIHSHDTRGHLHFCMLAKKTGVAFTQTKFITHLLKPKIWSVVANSEQVLGLAVLIRMHIERKCVENADIVVSSSDYLASFVEDYGYTLDWQQCFKLPKFPSTEREQQNTNAAKTINEVSIAYVGEFASAGGLHLFVDAINRMLANGVKEDIAFKLYIVGEPRKDHDFDSKLEALSENKRCAVKVISGFGVDEILIKLFDLNVDVIVQPCVSDVCNDMSAALLASGLPMIITNNGGLMEWVDSSMSHIRVCEPISPALADSIEGFIGANVATLDERTENQKLGVDTKTIWKNFIDQVSQDSDINNNTQILNTTVPDRPLVSVCIAHHNRGDLIQYALESVLLQTYTNLEIIIIDDGSVDPASIAVLDKIETDTHKFPVKVVRQQNRYLGAVRNTGIEHSAGEYILFMDDDNEARPEEIERFVDVALRTDADILTCFSDVFAGDRPFNSSIPNSRIVYHGDNLAVAMLRNPYGDSNCFIKKSSIAELGGFSEHYKVGLDDMEFFSRAVLSGLNVMLIPQSLYWYRINEVRMRQGQYNLFAGRHRVLAPFLQSLHPDIGNILLYASSMGFEHGPSGKKKGFKVSSRTVEFARRLVHRFPFLGGVMRYVYRKWV